MKERILRVLYYKYRSYFYGFLIEEFFYDIPKDIKEPAMTFLSQGKERLEKWALFQSHLLQTRLERDPDKIRTYQGMLLMLKLLLVHVEAPKRANAANPEQTGTKGPDPIKEAAEATIALRAMLSTDES